jgi:two-component system, chemotaxis family, sensor kinase CheA
MSDEIGSLQAQFYEDALDLLTDAEEVVLGLERDGVDQEQINALFRLFHTLKGNANMVGLAPVGSLCHALESQLDGVRKGSIPLDAALLQYSLEVIDLLAQSAAASEPDAVFPRIEALTEQLEKAFQLSGLAEVKDDKPVKRGESRSSSEAVQSDTMEDVPMAVASGLPEIVLRKEDAGVLIPLYAQILHYTAALRSGNSGEDSVDLLLELGMYAVDFRSGIDEQRYGNLAFLATCLEMFVTAMLRVQSSYDSITFELLFLLCDRISEQFERYLVTASWIRTEVVDEPMQLRDLVEQEINSEASNILAVKLRISEGLSLQISDLFNQLRRLRAERKEKVFILHEKGDRLIKAAALIEQSLGDSYPSIHTSYLDGMVEILQADKH